MVVQGYDLQSLAYELSTKIINGALLNLVNMEHTTNSQIYLKVGGGIIDMAKFKRTKITAIEFMVESGSLGTDGIDVQLYDKTNSAQIGLINFGGAEDDTLKFVDILSYLVNITGKITIEVHFRKAGAIGPSNISASSIQFYGVLT